ncbi:MAG: hypothetical protein HFI03_01850 [Lachnospiraceae bacterium]|nr:hypothetical protein [Lachnospiraceae bacterium]
MRSMDEILKDGKEKELNEMKAWLFREEFRLSMIREELDELRKKLDNEKKFHETEMKSQQHKLNVEKGRLEQENRLLEQKMRILQKGFEDLDLDRRSLQMEKDKFNSQRGSYHERRTYSSPHSEVAEMLFSGVNSFLTLKKRYKDLMKMFHPDNVTGDHEMVQIITREYEELKKAYEMGSRAR